MTDRGSALLPHALHAARATLAALALAAGLPAVAQDASVLKTIEARRDFDRAVAKDIWGWAEVGYQEQQSSARLQQELVEAGFKVEPGVAQIPTAFVASWGSGKPVIAILAEMDALPGVSQTASPVRDPIKGRNSGHACGHHLFGTASTSAAIAVKEWLAQTHGTGTIRLYGTPAEEGGAGKVYMVRAGLFDDVDVVLHWHPDDENGLDNNPSLANRSAKFRFRGTASHAAAAPERGRSALDGVEAMDYMTNLMREHVPQQTRIHYIITRGGDAPNVVPESAEVFYYVRHPDPEVMKSVFDRVVKAAEAAALGTGTSMDYEIIHGAYSLLPNDALGNAMYANLTRVGGITYDADEQAYAAKIAATFDKPENVLGSQQQIQPNVTEQGYGSTDVGDVSWVVPTMGLRTATWVPGTAAHSWQAVAAGGMSIGWKGMENAAKVLALTATQLYQQPKLVAAARTEFERRRGPGFKYVSLVGDRAPPLDYRR